jgi:hypothetical protein
VPSLRGVGVVVVALLLDFLLGFGLLLVLPEEGFVQQAAVQHQWLQGSGYGRPSRRSGGSPVDRVDWGYVYVMFKLFNSYIYKAESTFCRYSYEQSVHNKPAHNITNNKHKPFYYCKGGTTWGYD